MSENNKNLLDILASKLELMYSYCMGNLIKVQEKSKENTLWSISKLPFLKEIRTHYCSSLRKLDHRVICKKTQFSRFQEFKSACSQF